MCCWTYIVLSCISLRQISNFINRSWLNSCLTCRCWLIGIRNIIVTHHRCCLFHYKVMSDLHFFSPTPALSTISWPISSSMCSITPETANVGSSYNRMRGPGIGCWFSDRSNCNDWSLTLTFSLASENLSLYTTLLILLVHIPLCSSRCWHLNSNYCRTRCRQSQPRFVLSPLLLHRRLLA